MLTLNGVTVRALEPDDIDTIYVWETDVEMCMLGGGFPIQSKAAFRNRYEKRITEPEKDMQMLCIEFEGRLVGYMQLFQIDRQQRQAETGILLGIKDLWGRGIASSAWRILLDYAFTFLGLERIYAQAYGFNQRSQRLMERVGFVKEGVLRQHELHNGVRQDLHFYGILKMEFYQRYETLFKLS